MKKKLIVALGITVIAAFAFTGCGSPKVEEIPLEEATPVDVDEPVVNEVEAGDDAQAEVTEEDDDTEDVENAADEKSGEETGDETQEGSIEEAKDVDGEETAKASLPAYEYPGPELFYGILYKYMIDELAGNYPEADVAIPCPVILEMDESNKDDILVYGDFQIYLYNQNGDNLECSAGGSYPGVIHMKSDDEAGYVVTGMDIVEDGSNYTESAKKIFGSHYDAFEKMNSDDKLREETRAQIIANYVAANQLSIKTYQDYGWDPVQLPEENIDSFYSTLD
ncbi:MAG: hypothetical protein IKR58_04020 [Lachnospiraceae bacterium]|nr:hypothetical protein [Lachnospiraceae bacterium]